MDNNFKENAQRQMDKMKGQAERGAERVEKSMDNAEHEAKIKMSEEKEKFEKSQIKSNAEKNMDSLKGKVERGTEKVKQGFDNLTHDAKIKASEGKEKIQDKIHDMKDKYRNND